jgi:hypothetical protein
MEFRLRSHQKTARFVLMAGSQELCTKNSTSCSRALTSGGSRVMGEQADHNGVDCEPNMERSVAR